MLPLIWMTKLDVCPRLPAPLPVETFLSGPSSVLQPPSAPASKPVAMLAGAGAQRGATGTRTWGGTQAPSPGGVRANWTERELSAGRVTWLLSQWRMSRVLLIKEGTQSRSHSPAKPVTIFNPLMSCSFRCKMGSGSRWG